MLWIEMLFVVVFALLLSALLSWGLGWRHPGAEAAAGTSLLFLFLVLVFAMWAGASWLPPWGPVLYGASWLNVLMVGLLVCLIVLAVAAPVHRPPRSPREAAAEAEQQAEVSTVFGLFFWLLLAGLVVAGLARLVG
jgi:hypothetical protein